MNQLGTITGRVTSIRYRKEDSGWTILSLASGDMFGTEITAVGMLSPEPYQDEQMTLQGRWKKHPKYGEQFEIERVQKRQPPLTRDGLAAYLGSGRFHGIGEVLARRIVDTFGADTAHVLSDEPHRLAEVSGVSAARAGEIGKTWAAEEQTREIISYLCGLGLTVSMAAKIHLAYGKSTVAVIQENPYRLAWDVEGIGFLRADQIARAALNMPPHSPYRIEAGILHVLHDARNGEGHVYLPEPELVKRALELLRLKDAGAIRDVLAGMSGRNEDGGQPALIAEPHGLYLPSAYRAEFRAAEQVHALLQDDSTWEHLTAETITELLPGALAEMGITLSDEQTAAVRMALENRVAVITGGPGVGKTTILRTIVSICRGAGVSLGLCAPTGRAAKRMGEATGHGAYTIHRLLEFDPISGGFARKANNPLTYDLVIVDESSMLDLSLFHSLLQALKTGSHLLLVGDVDQLPSVGAGDVLRAMIDCGRVPVARLQHIYRQAEGSGIVVNAHRINTGRMPELTDAEGDFILLERTPEQVSATVRALVTEWIPQRFSLDPMTGVQVLAPMYRGTAGVDTLNAWLQDALLPPALGRMEYQTKTRTFRVGDKVMQLVNDYKKDVFNGDIGFVQAIIPTGDDKGLVVNFDGRDVKYKADELGDITLAYAVTVHKSQGGEFPVVILVVSKAHYIMLRRTLVYTGITRGKRAVILVGDKQALQIAVRNNTEARRYCALKERLQGE